MSVANLHAKGYTVINDVFTPKEVEIIAGQISQANAAKLTFRKTADLYAIRQFLKEVPQIQPLIFNAGLNAIIAQYFGPKYFVVKSIYFDKPQQSNWFVAWHQDLTISVDRKLDLPGFGPWTIKQGQYAVQPPLDILENIFTIRIHLDDTDENNGALRVIPGSHRHGVQRSKGPGVEEICTVNSGGIMIMRPLLQHASNRTTSGNRRRVIHIEFSNSSLPEGLAWAELSPPTSR
ncbi:phytanoyl-CoA dioxygenase family protein [Flavitalea sp. BT771]|uniref:phytanoyl-CoA dioxygenase family protein n=1 Tax=Flavitalea sp. BT771 TaxID=3063329 RepID=UPI0026E44BFE|nr:phytanoyl-CoA dioxygenase family protein [Flavitalea sp. BT771]MDO6433482.1 phytanoyl-CoA dioxygenase family protein [Flavitalea sp. BT771]MDV6222613.1 phytanoyl-CoA dioxygenase family protein [Flavitalea sp. BT771]